MRFAPRASNCSTNARPSPRFAPVTAATEPSILMANALSRIASRPLPTRPTTTEQNKTDRSVYNRTKKRGLHALPFAHQFQGSVTGHVGGAGVALDHGGYDGAFHQDGDGRRGLHPPFANRLLHQSAQKLAETL